MNAKPLGDFRYVARDLLVGFLMFSTIALFLLGGELPGEALLSMRVNAAEFATQAGTGAAPSSFHEGGGWTALAAMAVMFATLYAFNLALLRRYRRSTSLARSRRFSTR